MTTQFLALLLSCEPTSFRDGIIDVLHLLFRPRTATCPDSGPSGSILTRIPGMAHSPAAAFSFCISVSTSRVQSARRDEEQRR